MPAKNSPLLLLLALSAGCDRGAPGVEVAVASGDATPSCIGRDVTVLGGELYGAMRGRITATVANTTCRGMPRPAGNGARLQFVHTTGGGRPTEAGDTITVILGIDGLAELETGQGLRTTVTFVDGASARIFSSADAGTCRSDVLSHEPYAASAATLIRGVAYCTTAIPEVNGDGSVRVPELRFSGHVRWASPAAPAGAP